MPVYEYECDCGEKIEVICHVTEYQKIMGCACGGSAKQVIGHAFSHRDSDVPWLPSAVKVLQPDGERPVETRSELRKYLKLHGLISKG